MFIFCSLQTNAFRVRTAICIFGGPLPLPLVEFRLLRRGSAGLACDDDGVALGSYPLVRAESDGRCGRLICVASDDEIQKALLLAYGDLPTPRQIRITRALHSIAKAIAEGKYALARIMAVQMGLREFPEQALVRLREAAEFVKYNPDWPSEARDERGRWTDSDTASANIIPAIAPFSLECREAIARVANICVERFADGKVGRQGSGTDSFFAIRRCIRSLVPDDCGY